MAEEIDVSHVVADSKQVIPSVKRKPPAAGKGRKKGSVNKTTAALKDAILLAAQQVGHDGNGEDGLTGYLKKVAETDIKAFSSLLGRVIPLQVDGNLDSTVTFKTVYEDKR